MAKKRKKEGRRWGMQIGTENRSGKRKGKEGGKDTADGRQNNTQIFFSDLLICLFISLFEGQTCTEKKKGKRGRYHFKIYCIFI